MMAERTENELEGNIHFIGFNRDEAARFIRKIFMDCMSEVKNSSAGFGEEPLDIEQVCKLLGISAPTLKKFVDKGLIRRHDLGARKKVFYESEVQEDIKFLKIIKKR
jgi:excisionase family DNA binding protein